jgi:hypothetical protein
MKVTVTQDGKAQLRLTRREWEEMGKKGGWSENAEPVAFSKVDMNILLSKLYGKGLPGRMAINMLKSQPQRDAIMAILDIMGQNWSYWRPVLQDW